MLQLYLQIDFYNIIFKIKHKLYIASVSAPYPSPLKILGAHLVKTISFCNVNLVSFTSIVSSFFHATSPL